MASLSSRFSICADPFPPVNGGGADQLFAGAPRWVQHGLPHTGLHSPGSLSGPPMFTGPVQRVYAIFTRLRQMIYDPTYPVKPIRASPISFPYFH